MKVLNLRCASGHGFEGWFASEDDFLTQNGRGLIECPVCADRTVVRLPSAPRLNLSGASEPPAPPAARPPANPAQAEPRTTEGRPLPPEMQAAWLQAVRHLMANTEDVGERFAEEARRIHYGETPQRGIRGQTTDEERRSLSDEGIEVVSIPVPRALKEPLQ
ncbi:MAG: DUF1178 family protein [Proteobacteria bacterium]|nr:DUF1178 family protein [Pseudomonadota bacterium]